MFSLKKKSELHGPKWYQSMSLVMCKNEALKSLLQKSENRQVARMEIHHTHFPP